MRRSWRLDAEWDYIEPCYSLSKCSADSPRFEARTGTRYAGRTHCFFVVSQLKAGSAIESIGNVEAVKAMLNTLWGKELVENVGEHERASSIWARPRM